MTGSSIEMVAIGPMPGSTPMAVPEHAADEGVEQVLERQRDREAVRDVGEKLHASVPAEAGTVRAERLDENDAGEDGEQHGGDRELTEPTVGRRRTRDHHRQRTTPARDRSAARSGRTRRARRAR